VLGKLRGQLAKGFRFPPATKGEIAAEQAAIKCRIPGTLATMLTQVASGDFGPGYGLFGVTSRNRRKRGADPDTFRAKIEEYELADQPKGPWLPICTWGCGMLTIIHIPTGRLIRYDPNGDGLFSREDRSLESWLRAWLAGKDLFERCFDEKCYPGDQAFITAIKGKSKPA
jgi:hypothetical protein